MIPARPLILFFFVAVVCRFHQLSV